MFRTLDIGSDKLLPYVGAFDDDNPAMGWRAIRIGLDRPAILRQQLRALLIAARGRDLSVMFPMVSDVGEFNAARRILELELRRTVTRGSKAPARLRVGAMVEVPALMWQLPSLLRAVDFLSVGSNDLLQFIFASDRGSARVADRYDAISTAPLRMMRELARACARAKVPLNVCGEMAGRPLEAMALIGVGLRNLSMNPGSVGAVKAMVRSLRLKDVGEFLSMVLARDEGSIREMLRQFAADHGLLV